jgi:hypothetical protein
LKNSFLAFSIKKFAHKLLNIRSPQALKFTEITALVPFSTPTHDSAHNRVNERNGDVTTLDPRPNRKSLDIASPIGRKYEGWKPLGM